MDPSNNQAFRERIQAYAQNAGPGKRMPTKAYGECLVLISSGLDYLEENNGQTVIGALLAYVDVKEQREGMLLSMFNHGCNPLRIKEIDFSGIIQEKNLIDLLQNHLALEEFKGVGVRDEQGGNFYHALALRNSWRLGDAVFELYAHLHLSPAEQMKRVGHLSGYSKQRERGQMAWVQGRREDGKTPLHVLWSKDMLTNEGITGLDGQGVTGGVRVLGINKNCAGTAQTLMILGADMLAEDNQGITPWHLMRQRVEACPDPKPNPRIDAIFAHTEARVLERDTPGSKNTQHKPGPRL